MLFAIERNVFLGILRRERESLALSTLTDSMALWELLLVIVGPIYLYFVFATAVLFTFP